MQEHFSASIAEVSPLCVYAAYLLEQRFPYHGSDRAVLSFHLEAVHVSQFVFGRIALAM